MTRTLLVALATLLLLARADAAPLGPAKPNQVVTLTAAAEACTIPNSPDGLLYKSQVMPHGTVAPFTIPPGHVLVLTGIV